jgi:hypothetical protein
MRTKNAAAANRMMSRAVIAIETGIATASILGVGPPARPESARDAWGRAVP